MTRGETMSMEELYGRLTAPARRALETLNLRTLEDLAARSEDEVAALPGIGKAAMETIRDVLAGQGLSLAPGVERPALTDPDISPDERVLSETLGASYPLYLSLLEELARREPPAIPEWRFYRDGNAWLCKVVRKKKTLFWLTPYRERFRTTFYFTGRALAALEAAGIPASYVEEFREETERVKNPPVRVIVDAPDRIGIVLNLATLKADLKQA